MGKRIKNETWRTKSVVIPIPEEHSNYGKTFTLTVADNGCHFIAVDDCTPFNLADFADLAKLRGPLYLIDSIFEYIKSLDFGGFCRECDKEYFLNLTSRILLYRYQDHLKDKYAKDCECIYFRMRDNDDKLLDYYFYKGSVYDTDDTLFMEGYYLEIFEDGESDTRRLVDLSEPVVYCKNIDPILSLIDIVFVITKYFDDEDQEKENLKNLNEMFGTLNGGKKDAES